MSIRRSAEPGRRAALGALLAAAVAVRAAAQPSAAGWDRPFTLLVPFSPGTTIDILARLTAEHLRRRTGAVAAVENRVGASGIIASQVVARAPPDGHTLLVTTNTFVTTPSLVRAMPYDPLADFAPVAHLADVAMALCVHPSVPADTVESFVALARARPGEFDYASPGNGSPQHLAMALFAGVAGIRLTHVPYRGSAGALQDLGAGVVAAMFVPVNAAVPLREDGRLRLLAVAAPARSVIAPDVPTLAEAGYPGLEMEVWFGLLAPARTPDAVVRALNAELLAMLRDDAVRGVFRAQDLTAAGGPPEAFGALLARERARWDAVIRAAHISAD